jgi:hypothetical protein
MMGVAWSLVDAVALLLERDEREAVLGDLAEAGESPWHGLLDVVGLIVRRQAFPWRSWRPWLAAFALALPGSLLLMGFSLSVSQSCLQFINPPILKATGLTVRPGLWLLCCNVFLLVGWSWSGGFVMGSLSRRTLGVSSALSLIPCLFCLARFRIESLSRFCLLLFLPPAIWGVRRGLQISNVKLSSALVLAVAVTALTIPTWGSRGPWIPNWALSWPAWYLVATARRPASPALGRPTNSVLIGREKDGE